MQVVETLPAAIKGKGATYRAEAPCKPSTGGEGEKEVNGE